MPYLSNLGYIEEPSQQYLKDVFNSVQLKDVIKRNNIRYIDLLERIISYVMQNVGTNFSVTSLSKFLKSENRKVSSKTILNYIKYCCDAYLLYRVKRYDLQGKQLLTTNMVSVKQYLAAICVI